jgi:single-strand DNA-binding protein
MEISRMSIYSTSGLVATTPRHYATPDGVFITTFRMADNMVFDEPTQTWVGAENCNWFTIKTSGQLALNAAASVKKGDRVVVSGTILVRDWDNGERAGTSIEIQARSLGGDLAFGVSEYKRTDKGLLGGN